MDVDRISYIFGSFSRRRQSQDGTCAKRRSIIPSGSASTISHKSNPNGGATGSASTKSSPIKASKVSLGAKTAIAQPVTVAVVAVKPQEVVFAASPAKNAKCEVCKEDFVEPRVLPCLHTFCTRCLVNIATPEYSWHKDFDGSSSGSGYESEKRDATSSNETWSPKATSSNRTQSCPEEVSQKIVCPTCNFRHTLPTAGVLSLPPNYLLGHAKEPKYENQDAIRVLCDLCSFDVSASNHCKTCVKNMCPLCCDSHHRQRSTSGHQISRLHTKQTTTNCPVHLDCQLQLFCTSCLLAVCQKCCIESHEGHACELIANLTRFYSKSIRDALVRARPAAEQASNALEQLQSISRKIETRSNIVQKEVEGFIEIYKHALDEHKQTLLSQVRKSREDKLQVVGAQKNSLEHRVEEAVHTIQFAEDLLANGSGVEMLSFVGPLLEKLEWCSDIGRQVEPRVTDCIQFLPDEMVPATANKTPLYGMITTQTVSPQHCILTSEGLQNLRVHRKAECLVETRDGDNHQLCHGGEIVTTELRFLDSSLRTIPVTVTDLRDGAYSLTFIPDTAGHLHLSVFIRGKQIKGSPFAVAVRTIRPHHGSYHCCSFCSSGGNKQATCGCGGKMPGGYKGCGHGHEGHPGKRHWSCCGIVYEHSECNTVSASHYQFTL